VAIRANEARIEVDPGRQLALFDEAPAAPEHVRADSIVRSERSNRSRSERSKPLERRAAALDARPGRPDHPEAVKDKSYRKTPLGQLVGRYLRWVRNEWHDGFDDPRLRSGARAHEPPACRPRASRGFDRGLREVIDNWAMRPARAPVVLVLVRDLRQLRVGGGHRLAVLAELAQDARELLPGCDRREAAGRTSRRRCRRPRERLAVVVLPLDLEGVPRPRATC
jgi:hypothetical protein